MDSVEIPEDLNTATSCIPSKEVTEMLKQRNLEVPNIPKTIKIRPATIYESKKGMFPCKTINGLYNTNFLLADGYLYVHGLLKSNIQ